MTCVCVGSVGLPGPKGVAVNSEGHLVVVDNKASSVLVFHSGSGKLLHRFGSRGADPDKLAGPHYVAVNSKGHIVVSDFHNHSIKVGDDEWHQPTLTSDQYSRISICATMNVVGQLGECLEKALPFTVSGVLQKKNQVWARCT